jgi:hypothetical protein
MKQNKKKKTIQLDSEIHAKLKTYCDDNSLKINLFVEKLISNNIRSLIADKQSKTT